MQGSSKVTPIVDLTTPKVIEVDNKADINDLKASETDLRASEGNAKPEKIPLNPKDQQEEVGPDLDAVPEGFSISKLIVALGARELTKIVAGYRDRSKTPIGDVTVIGEMGG